MMRMRMRMQLGAAVRKKACMGRKRGTPAPAILGSVCSGAKKDEEEEEMKIIIIIIIP